MGWGGGEAVITWAEKVNLLRETGRDPSGHSLFVLSRASEGTFKSRAEIKETWK